MESGFLTLFFFGACFYLLPAVISIVRRTGHGVAIRVINIFFGWTVLGWIAALIWSIVEAPQKSTMDDKLVACPRCRRANKSTRSECMACGAGL